MENILLLTDSYKLSHWKQYPPGTETVGSYFESRGGQYDKVVFFGLQYLLKKYLAGKVVTKGFIDEAADITESHMGSGIFNYQGWKQLLEDYQGVLPIRIKAVPEGMKIPTRNVLMTVKNTDPKYFWLTNFIETLLVQLWYPCTVATLSNEIKQTILKFLNETGTPESINFKLHDFGFRGVSSVESAGIGGAAHLLSFKGTDTLVSLTTLRNYYKETGMPAHAVPASEHSTMTSWGQEHEVDAFRNMLEQYPGGLVSVVSDSYDILNACRNLWGKRLKQEVLERDGVLVVRPDSGNPESTVLDVVSALGDRFGYSINDKGFKVLNPKVRVIQGDGVNHSSITTILHRLKAWGWSADNVVFGMGGALLQQLNRDTQKFALKCSYIIRNGKFQHVFKKPSGDATKASKAGMLRLAKTDKRYVTYDSHADLEVRFKVDPNESLLSADLLESVFYNGQIQKEYSLEEIRSNLSQTENEFQTVFSIPAEKNKVWSDRSTP